MTRARDRVEVGPECGRCRTANNEKRSFCRECGQYLKKPKPMSRSRTPIKRVSDSRALNIDERRDVVDASRVRDGGKCQAQKLHAIERSVPCRGRLDPHEIIPRSAWAAGYLVLDNVITVCEHAHRWIDAHPHGAHALGLHGWSWERPGTPAADSIRRRCEDGEPVAHLAAEFNTAIVTIERIRDYPAWLT